MEAVVLQTSHTLSMNKKLHFADAMTVDGRCVLLWNPRELHPGAAFFLTGSAADVVEREDFVSVAGGFALLDAAKVIGELGRVDDAAGELDQGAGHEGVPGLLTSR